LAFFHYPIDEHAGILGFVMRIMNWIGCGSKSIITQSLFIHAALWKEISVSKINPSEFAGTGRFKPDIRIGILPIFIVAE
jgi:hypothetical protein